MNDHASELDVVGLLHEPTRRAVYEWVAGTGRSVGRDETGSAVGITRALAAFHLDRLAQAGLLDVEYRRLSGRTGPGAGRPAKLYRRGSREVFVSLPERRYDVPAQLFADAMERMAGPQPADAVATAAHKLGQCVGSTARREAGQGPSHSRLRTALRDTLKERGYEPFETDSGEIRLRNCPFHALVADHRDLVCGMNLALAGGLLDGLGDDRFAARLDPQPGQCCVAFTDRS